MSVLFFSLKTQVISNYKQVKKQVCWHLTLTNNSNGNGFEVEVYYTCGAYLTCFPI